LLFFKIKKITKKNKKIKDRRTSLASKPASLREPVLLVVRACPDCYFFLFFSLFFGTLKKKLPNTHTF